MTETLHAAAARWLAGVPRYPVAPDRGDVRLASNESPFGPSPRALAAAARAISGAYPDAAATPLRVEIAHRLAVGAGEVVVTSGSSEAIQLLLQAFPGEVVAPLGSFPLYARIAGPRFRGAARGPDGGVDLAALRACIGPATGLVFLANPDNPTGGSVAGLASWLRSLPPTVLPVVDEAYIEFSGRDSAVHLRGVHPNLVVLRSFSKAWGLAALRVGCAVAPAAVVDALDRVRVPFNVSAPAQAAALAALDDTAWLQRTLVHNTRARADLAAALTRRGFATLPSDANFVFLPEAPGLAAALADHGVTIRPMDAWGFPGAARITVGRDADHARLLDAIDQILANERCAG